MNWLPRKATPRPPLSPRPETPLSFNQPFITDVDILHKCRVAPLRDWINTYHNYDPKKITREWSLLALRSAVTMITYAVHTMSRDVVDIQAALDENRSDDESENQSILSEGAVESEDERRDREKKELQFRQIVFLEASVKDLLKAYQADHDALMIEDRIAECQRILIMIVGTDQNGAAI
ncbi:hypothetical protein FKW77_006986 [Venturia effusa]|uniref:Uncharacterized protein n=1 Tax=Venturia effusa TaxID=50376 RepID=A0A517LN94_9PEZI|nr:hypothetical protein FKW77_006986 [Venturia effusa]